MSRSCKALGTFKSDGLCPVSRNESVLTQDDFHFLFQMGLQRWWEQEIPVDGPINKGELMSHNLTELIKPESYEVRLTPITRFGEGDSTIRIIRYSGECSL